MIELKLMKNFTVFIFLLTAGCVSIFRSIQTHPESYRNVNVYNDDGTLKAGEIAFLYLPAPGEEVDSVYLAGDMNGRQFAQTNYFMAGDGEGDFTVTIRLEAGDYGFKYLIDGDWVDRMSGISNRILPRSDDYELDRFSGGVAIIKVR